MRYVRAQDILPREVLELLQNYVDGECVYIPRREENRRSWGESTQSKGETRRRNGAIYRDYLRGVSVPALSESYYLSEKSIRRILSEEKKAAEPPGV